MNASVYDTLIVGQIVFSPSFAQTVSNYTFSFIENNNGTSALHTNETQLVRMSLRRSASFHSKKMGNVRVFELEIFWIQILSAPYCLGVIRAVV